MAKNSLRIYGVIYITLKPATKPEVMQEKYIPSYFPKRFLILQKDIVLYITSNATPLRHLQIQLLRYHRCLNLHAE